VAEISLRGCSPEPLSAYLKALGVLRLVGEQADPGVRGAWGTRGFLLSSTLDERALLDFFLERYAPTPVIAPWNGGSGFYPGDNEKALNAIAASSGPRFATYRAAITAAREVLVRLKAAEKPEKEFKVFKERELLPALRSELPDAALHWLDAAVVLTGDGPKYPPLLGTGGNDGRLDFTNNQMQRLLEALAWKDNKGRVQSEQLLRASLFASPCIGLRSVAIGQFNPAAAGGSNAGPGFSRDALVNPWDYVLTLEGTLFFASAATKRLESGSASAMAFPFMVASSGVGYASSSSADERGSRNELWLPIWETAANLLELRGLFSEGRAKVGRRDARTGMDFARAIGSLGVDRGIQSFARYGFHMRNGLNYFATPLGRLAVRRRPQLDLLSPLDSWLLELRRAAAGERAPASLQRAVRALESAIMEVCSSSEDRPTQILIALGEVERVLARSREPLAPPVPALEAAWLEAADDDSIEFRLARSLASTGIRERIVPVRWSKPCTWELRRDGRTVWGAGGLVQNLLAVVEREEIERSQGKEHSTGDPQLGVELGALQAFEDGHTDDVRLEQLLRGLALVRYMRAQPSRETKSFSGAIPSAAFALLALARAREPRLGTRLPRTPGMVARAASGDLASAVALASRRLRGAGLSPRIEVVRAPRADVLRTAAALAFPLGPHALARLADRLLVPERTIPNA